MRLTRGGAVFSRPDEALRVEREVHGSDVFDYADQMSHTLHEVRRTAESLRGIVEGFVSEQAAASLEAS